MFNVTFRRISASLVLSIGCTAERSPPEPPVPPLAPGVDAEPVRASVPSNSTTPPVVSAAIPETVPENDWRRYYDSTERIALRTAEGKASRAGTVLRIQLLNGRTALFKEDTTAGLKFAVPRYNGYMKTIRSHSIHIIQYEGAGAYLVVDDSTGDSTIVFGEPVASPDGKRFVLTSMAGEAGYNSGMIEVWRMVGRKPEKEFHLNTESGPWEPSDPVWRDSVTIDFIKNTHQRAGDPYVETPGRLTRTGTTWMLSDSMPHKSQ